MTAKGWHILGIGALWGVAIGLALGIWIYHNFLMQKTIDRRARDLALMHWSGDEGKFVPKEEHKWILKYLKDGHMREGPQ